MFDLDLHQLQSVVSPSAVIRGAAGHGAPPPRMMNATIHPVIAKR